MNTGNIVEKFELLSGIEGSESIKWRSVVDDACAYVYSRIADKPLSASDERRIEFLCAVYAYKLYVMCGKSEVSSFKAPTATKRFGDVDDTEEDKSNCSKRYCYI